MSLPEPLDLFAEFQQDCRIREMEAFDRLPPAVRHALANAADPPLAQTIEVWMHDGGLSEEKVIAYINL